MKLGGRQGGVDLITFMKSYQTAAIYHARLNALVQQPLLWLASEPPGLMNNAPTVCVSTARRQ